MLADFWMDLLNPANRRGHPVLSALLYTFCPAASRWWQAGADPVISFDPLWQAHNLRASGLTLREALESRGLGELMVHARKYVEQVGAFREQLQNRHIRAPELLPTFLGGKLPFAARHGLASAFEQIGGWQNFYPFVRAWAFSLRDWQAAFGLPAIPELERTGMTMKMFSAEPILLSIWKLRGSGRTALGLLVSGSRYQTGWIAEVFLHSLNGIYTEDLYLLSEAGHAVRVETRLGPAVLRTLLERVSAITQTGPFLPVNALNDPARCRRCGFHHLCWVEGEPGLSPIALAF